MTKNKKTDDLITPLEILDLYRSGIFIMANDRKSKNIFFVEPKKRALLPIKNFHCSRSFIRFIKKKPFEVTINKKFEEVIHQCATINRKNTWINNTIEKKFIELYEEGYAHSIECWTDNNLEGGIYGVSLGSCFFAESMFSKKTNASKYALIHLVSRLWKLDYKLLDVQFVNDHLIQFGVYEITRDEFRNKINHYLKKTRDFYSFDQSKEDLFKDVLNFLQVIRVKS